MFWDNLHGVFTLISLGMTFPALTVCVLVLRSWHRRYLDYMLKKDRKPSTMLIAGVYLSFMGSMIDNSWWGLAWTFYYLDHGWRDFFFVNGVYPNTFFRQGALIWAGTLHVLSENMARTVKSDRKRASLRSKTLVAGSVPIGALYCLLLFAVKSAP